MVPARLRVLLLPNGHYYRPNLNLRFYRTCISFEELANRNIAVFLWVLLHPWVGPDVVDVYDKFTLTNEPHGTPVTLPHYHHRCPNHSHPSHT